jgi:ribosomal protein L15
MSAGKGKTSGRGMKGYQARQNTRGPTRAFQGGQTTLSRGIPKLGVRP